MFNKIFALHQALGLAPLNQLGQWDQPLPNGWHMVVNGGTEPIKAYAEQGGAVVVVNPFTAAFWYNGWPAGQIRPFVDERGQVAEQGWIAAGDGANETTLAMAIDELMNKARI